MLLAVAQDKHSKEIEDARHLSVVKGVLMPVFALFNLILVGSWIHCYPEGILSHIPYQALLYFVSLACISFFRLSIGRLRYGCGHKENEAFDKWLLDFFGLHLVERGSTARWIYPVLSTVPVWVIMCVIDWRNMTTYSVMCSPGVNGTFVLDAKHCSLDHTLGKGGIPLRSLPYFSSSLMLIYYAMQGFATLMVKLDPITAPVSVSTEFWNHMEIYDKISPRGTKLEQSKRDVKEMQKELSKMAAKLAELQDMQEELLSSSECLSQRGRSGSDLSIDSIPKPTLLTLRSRVNDDKRKPKRW
jgi:hypothetical protein